MNVIDMLLGARACVRKEVAQLNEAIFPNDDLT